MTSDTSSAKPIHEFEYHFKVLETHLDTFGHMNHATYLVVFEQARWEFITEHGWGLREIQKAQIGPTILEVKVRYKRELRLREDVTIRSKVYPAEGKLSKIEQTMFNSKNEACCEIELLIGLFDMQKRRLIAPPDSWISKP